jgi:DNA-binding HxlR family transcriptional regulator
MSSRLTLDELVALGKYRWAVPLLADLAVHKGGRFVELLHCLVISRDSLTRTLEGAVAMGWVKHNPGHGHPLRPEYILTEAGERLAASAAQIEAAQNRLGLAPAQMSRWSLPIIRSIAHGSERFNDIARNLPATSPRALSLGLQGLSKQRLVMRALVDGYPPTSHYSLTGGGLLLATAT